MCALHWSVPLYCWCASLIRYILLYTTHLLPTWALIAVRTILLFKKNNRYFVKFWNKLLKYDDSTENVYNHTILLLVLFIYQLSSVWLLCQLLLLLLLILLLLLLSLFVHSLIHLFIYIIFIDFLDRFKINIFMQIWCFFHFKCFPKCGFK